MSLESVWEAFSTVYIDVLKLHPILAVFRDSRGGQERNPREKRGYTVFSILLMMLMKL